MGYGKLAKGVSEAEARRKLQNVMPQQKRKKNFRGKAPSIFVGSHNYPDVNTGVLSPQHFGNPELMDSPKKWYEKSFSIERIASLRTSLVNSRKKSKRNVETGFLTDTQEVAMARKPVDIEVKLESAPRNSISAGRVKPVSASGDLNKLIINENPSVERKVEKAFYDTDLKAETAVHELHQKGVDSYKIQQSFTAGLLGEEANKELVPTRWSITATDDIISKKIRRDVKSFQEIGQLEYYRNEYVGNEFHIFLIPGRWEYELIELKRPGSVWNAAANTYIAQNHESFSGRSNYAEETAGAFYAARLGVLEHLRNRKRQAKALILREVKPSYWAPLGVWVIRETVRNAFKEKPEEMDSFEDVKFEIGNNFKFLYNKLKKKSKMIGSRQSSIQDF
jgi:hypothetical protein